MNMNKKTIITILLAIVTMTGQAQVNYRLEGNIGDSTITGKAVVRDMYAHSGEIIDTVNIIKGIIEPVEGELSDTTICALIIGDMPEGKGIHLDRYLYPVFMGGGTTVFDGRSLRHPFLKGTTMCEDLTLFHKTESEVTTKWMMERIRKANGGPMKITTADMGREQTEQVEKTAIDIISRHTSDMLGLYLLREGAINYLSPSTWLELFSKMEPWLMTKPTVYNMSSFKSMMEKTVKTSEGTMFVDMESEVDGHTCRLSDYVGKGRYVLADFWQSTCAPCLTQIPMMKSIYQRYNERGLTVLGIAVSEDAEKSRRAIEKHGITYPQLLNTQDQSSDAYGIQAIPYSILFAPDGTILARGLRGEEIEKKLEEIFNNK
jgi:peroxiredoxin